MNTPKGFTLLELMIAVAVIGILSVIAILNYQSYMIKTRRAAAAACLLVMSQSLERSYTVNMSYAKKSDGADSGDGDDADSSPDVQCKNDLAGHYTFSLNVPPNAARTFLLSATPQGAQSDKDSSECGTLTLDQAGKKGATGDVSTCWK